MDFNPNKKPIVKDEKIKEIENDIKDLKMKYDSLDEEYDRVDHSGVSTVKLGEEMANIQKTIARLEQELIELKK